MKRKDFLFTPILAVPDFGLSGKSRLRPMGNPFKVDINYVPEITEQEISKFIFDSKTQKFAGSIPTEPGYNLLGTKISGSQATDLLANRKEYYNVYYNRTLVSDFSVIIPIVQKAMLSITAYMLVKPSVSGPDQDKIRQALANYDPSIGVDAAEYASLQDQFTIRCSFELEKTGDPIEHKEQLNAMLAQYMDVKGTGKITTMGGSNKVTGIGTKFLTELFPGSVLMLATRSTIGIVKSISSDLELILEKNAINSGNNIEFIIDVQSRFYVAGETISVSDYFRKKKYRVVKMKPENLEMLEKPAIDSIHEVEGNDPAALVDAIVQTDAKPLDCNAKIIVDQVKIIDIMAWPEFKTEFVFRKVKIGCVEVPLPWFHETKVRYTIKTLYAAIGRPDNIDQLVKDQLIDCAKYSAGAAVVVGIWLENFPSALIAFKALFGKCVVSTVEGDLICLIPDLVILSESTPWRDI